MKTLTTAALLFVCIVSVGRTENTTNGFTPIFDGKTLDGWTVTGPEKDGWIVKDGEIAWNGRGGYLRYDTPLRNFVLRMEFKVSKKSNSGVLLHTRKDGAPPFTGFEVQIYADHGREPNKNSSGSIYDVLTPMRNMTKPTGQWNSFEITCKGPHVKVIYNEFKVIDTDFSQLTEPIGKFKFPYASLPREGYLQLQDHGHPVWFRNLQVKVLE